MKYTTYYVNLIENGKGKRWQARAKYKDAKGNWRETSKVLKDASGKREANRMAEEWFDKLNEEADLMPNVSKAKTLEETFTEYLNHQLTTSEIEKSTHTNSMYYFKKYIKPYLGDYLFASIDKTVLNWWLTELYKMGLSQNTIHTVYARLKKVYNYFYDCGELLKDPFKGVKVPKKGEAKITHLTKEQMEDVLTAVHSNYEAKDPMFAGILLAFYAGLRRGEICGLRWNDIDFYKKTITVRSAIAVASANGGKKGDYAKGPKNKSSHRTFYMMPHLEEALLERKKAIDPKPSWFIVGDKEEFLRPSQYSRLFSEFVDRNNLVDAYGQKIVPHGLRHNFATVGIRGGVDIASLALMMGHASRAMTLDTYGDANADALKMSSIKLKNTFNENTNWFATGGEQEDEE